MDNRFPSSGRTKMITPVLPREFHEARLQAKRDQLARSREEQMQRLLAFIKTSLKQCSRADPEAR